MPELIMNIKGNDKQYPIHILTNDISNLKASIQKQINNKNYIVVISHYVYKLYSKTLDFPKDKIYILKDGELEKNEKNFLKILNFALSKKLKRDDFIIAIGGGVVGDLTGFVASTYMRGINFIQVPTTLLAMTDSSVGGKVAINTKYGKNLVGAFYQPKSVFININFLKTLDKEQFKSGLGEVIKYGFIEKSCDNDSDSNVLNFLHEHHNDILNKDILILADLVEKCVKLKIAVVSKDEKESGLRKILNYGHTYAHAIEKLTNYKKYTHGHCVIEGIKFALDISKKLNIIEKEYAFLCEDVIKNFEYSSLGKFNSAKVIEIMTTDKKSKDGLINFILPTCFAKVEEYGFEKEELKEFIKG